MAQQAGRLVGPRVSGGLVGQVGRAIDGEIAAGKLAPGAFLGREADLMARFGVSRPTLRAAVRQLEAANRIVTRPGVGGGLYVGDTAGTAVMALATHMVMLGQPLRAFFAVNMPFFEWAATEAARHGSPEDRARIADILARMDAEPDRLSFFQSSRMALRGEIFAATSNPAAQLIGSAMGEAYAGILRGELHLGDTEQEKTRTIKVAERRIGMAILSGDAAATITACRAAAALEMAVNREAAAAGMAPARSVPSTLFATVPDDRPPDKLAAHMARALRREIDLIQAPPGSSLGAIGTIAARFGVSYDICREALGLLAGHGIVEMRRGRSGGVRIGQPTIAAFADTVRRDLMAVADARQVGDVGKALAAIRRGLRADDLLAAESRPTAAFLDQLLALLHACGTQAIAHPAPIG